VIKPRPFIPPLFTRVYAAERTLLAVGSRNLGTIGRMRLGSVSTKVVHAAKGPVLVHPPRAPRHRRRG